MIYIIFNNCHDIGCEKNEWPVEYVDTDKERAIKYFDLTYSHTKNIPSKFGHCEYVLCEFEKYYQRFDYKNNIIMSIKNNDE